jgi:putative component of membrane protein insertase Oxa1/YidC/SpoIIIJ protein YidD
MRTIQKLFNKECNFPVTCLSYLLRTLESGSPTAVQENGVMHFILRSHP